MKTVYIAVVVSLLTGIVGTHFIETGYYHRQMDKSDQYELKRETDLGLDFNEVVSQSYPKQIDCSKLRFQPNVDYCHTINGLRE